MSLTELDYYAALEVSPKATPAEVLEAYHRVADNYREDALASYGLLSEEERKSIVDFLDTALRVLSDETRRAAYDQKLLKDGAYSAEDLARPKAPQPVRAEPASVSPANGELGGAGLKPELRVTQPAAAEIPSAFVMPKAPAEASVAPERAAIKPSRNLLDVIGERPVGGAELREMRESGGYSLEDVTAVTKVSLSNLRFIESMDLSFLPAPVYLKGSLRTYAKFLRIDPERVVGDYMKLYEARKSGNP